MGLRGSHHDHGRAADHELVNVIFAGERNRHIADLIGSALKYRHIKAFLTEILDFGQQTHNANDEFMHGLPVGVVILTRDFVCEKLAMDDVHRLLRRVDRDSGGKYPFVLIPVFLGVSPDECEDLLHRVYSDPDLWKAQPGHPRSHPKPNQATLTKWAGWARQLTCTGVAKQPQQVDDMKSYAEMVADECERHLILSGRIKRPSDVPKAALQTPVVAALIGTNAKQPRTHGHESYEEAVW